MTELKHGLEAFESVAKPFLPLLWRCARRLMRTGHEAEDLVQETCLKAFRAWHQLQPGTDARAWLVTILLNTARDWARKTLRQPETLGLDELTALYQQATTEPGACHHTRTSRRTGGSGTPGPSGVGRFVPGVSDDCAPC